MMAHVVRAQTRQFTIVGFGNSSCGWWTAQRRSDATGEGPEQWVLGFLAGAGFLGHRGGIDPLAGVDADGVFGWVDNYCMAHPLSKIAEASVAFSLAHPR